VSISRTAGPSVRVLFARHIGPDGGASRRG